MGILKYLNSLFKIIWRNLLHLQHPWKEALQFQLTFRDGEAAPHISYIRDPLLKHLKSWFCGFLQDWIIKHTQLRIPHLHTKGISLARNYYPPVILSPSNPLVHVLRPDPSVKSGNSSPLVEAHQWGNYSSWPLPGGCASGYWTGGCLWNGHNVFVPSILIKAC